MKKFLVIFLALFLFSCNSGNISQNTENNSGTTIIESNSGATTTENSVSVNEMLDIRFVISDGTSDESNDSSVEVFTFENFSDLEKFFKEFSLPNNMENGEINIYIDGYKLTGMGYHDIYSEPVMKKILAIFKTRPDIMKYTHLQVSAIYWYHLDVSFIYQTTITEISLYGENVEKR